MKILWIGNYVQKAYLFGCKHHDRQWIQEELMKDFLDATGCVEQ